MSGPGSAIIRRRWAVVALLLAALLAPSTMMASEAATPARSVRVTAGEHGDYSRVVFALGGVGYRTVPEAGGLRVVVPDAPVAFEYDDVYPKRRAHRVIGAEAASGADGAALRLRFGCDCTTRTFLLDDKLVVDIFDEAFDAGGTPAADAAPPAPAAGSDADAAAQADAQAAPTGRDDPKQPRPDFLQRVENLAVPEPQPPELADGSAADGFDHEHLRRMLEWAVEQGHLTDASGRDSGEPPSHPSKDEESSVSAATAGLSEPPSPMAALSPDATSSPMEAAQIAPESSCPDASALDMAVLGGEGPFDAGLAERQDALSRAFAAGHGALQAQYALAGFYIARLMPQEALAALPETDGQRVGPVRAWLRAAALVLANRPDQVASDEFLDSPCKGADAQLWRSVVLAAHGLIAQDAFDSDVILERLATYPPELRVELGLRLAEDGMGAVAPATLEQLLDLVEGAPVTAEARARMLFLRGRFAAERGDFAGARADWRAAAGLPGDGGARATLALLQADLDLGELDERTALLELERLAYDWRGNPLQLPIARLTAAIYERRNRLGHALGVLEEVALGSAGLPNGRAAARAATDLMRRAYVDGPAVLPSDQLAAFWRYEGFVPPGPEGADIRLAFAKSLMANGLPGMAADLLEPIARDGDRPLADEAIDFLVEAYIAAQEPSKALDVLRAAGRDIARPRRNLLAARALAELGRFAEAAGVLHVMTGDQARRLQADYLWKAGLWKKSAVAYREQLRTGRDQGDDADRAVMRFAAAAYMADEPAMLDGLPAEDAGKRRIVSAFAPLPPSVPVPGNRLARSAAARLVEQARGLEELAGQYGLQEQAPR